MTRVFFFLVERLVAGGGGGGNNGTFSGDPCFFFFLVERLVAGGGGRGASEQHNNTICIHSYDMRPNSPMSILSCCHRRFIRLCCFILSAVRNKTHKIIQYHLLLFSYFQNKHILSCS